MLGLFCTLSTQTQFFTTFFLKSHQCQNSNDFVFPYSEENPSKSQSPKADPGHPEKCSPVVIDDVSLNGPTLNVLAAENFIHQSMAIIMEDAVKKATDVREKVKV